MPRSASCLSRRSTSVGPFPILFPPPVPAPIRTRGSGLQVPATSSSERVSHDERRASRSTWIQSRRGCQSDPQGSLSRSQGRKAAAGGSVPSWPVLTALASWINDAAPMDGAPTLREQLLWSNGLLPGDLTRGPGTHSFGRCLRGEGDPLWRLPGIPLSPATLLYRGASLIAIVLLATIGGCKVAPRKQMGPVATPVVQPTVQSISKQVPTQPVRVCKTLEDNARALKDIDLGISDARDLAKAGHLADALDKIQAARGVEAACFGSLESRTNWSQVEGRLYSFEAARRFPDIPSNWISKCARKPDPMSTADMIICGPDIIYYVEPRESLPFALRIVVASVEDQPLGVSPCHDSAERTIQDPVLRATLNVGSSIRLKFYEHANVLTTAGWIRDRGKTLCEISSCRENQEKGIGGPCRIPENAKRIEPQPRSEVPPQVASDSESLSLRCEVDRVIEDGRVLFPHPMDPPGARLPGRQFLSDGKVLTCLIGGSRYRMSIVRQDLQTIVAQNREANAGQITDQQVEIDKVKLKATSTLVRTVPVGTRSMSGEDIGGKHTSIFSLSCRGGVAAENGLRSGSAGVGGGHTLKQDSSSTAPRRRSEANGHSEASDESASTPNRSSAPQEQSGPVQDHSKAEPAKWVDPFTQ